MASNSVNLDLSDLAAEIRAAGPQGRKAAAQAINSSLELARSDAARYIADRYTLPPSYSETRIKIPKRASETRLNGGLQVRRRSTKFNQFKHTQKWVKGKTVARKRAGIDVKIKTNGTTTHWDDAWYIKLNNGNTGIAVRAGNGKGQVYGRNDIHILYSVSVGGAFQYVRDETDLTYRMLEHAKTEFFRYMSK